MELENKFLVLKIADIEEALVSTDKQKLQLFATRVDEWRLDHGKKLNTYVVINQDEPYFPDVLKLMDRCIRDYNEHDAVCDECKAKRNAMWCEWCSTFTCIHYSLFANDDAGPGGEQLVHRCNDCESELTEKP